jgi:two-component system alkaline phosphatase synthesis response regulator PhoP
MGQDGLTDTVVLIEDEPVIANVMKFLVGSFDVPMEIATTAESGIDLVRRARPKLVLLDVNLPDRSGDEVCAEIRRDEAIADCFVLLISTHDAENLGAMAERSGADGFLCKPFDPDALLNHVRAVLGHRERPAAGVSTSPGY